MKISSFFKKKTISFVIQFFLLTLMIFLFNYSFIIEFDQNIAIEQRDIIQFLANYVLFRDVNGIIFMYLAWLVVSLLPILINQDPKKACSINFLSFFVLNFFVYIFLFNEDMRVTSDFFTLNFVPLLWNTIILGIVILIYSFLISLLLKKRKSSQLEKKASDLLLNDKPLMVCPNCGTEFDSIPLYCFKCNSKLITDEAETNE
ncbi:MAG: zinc ribbon domain-containing protein [Promethearchaeota archaeon]|nr:MAG: zinc ribbon domain-containing protein [Candidatus Lokiarchaeota archaeon]